MGEESREMEEEWTIREPIVKPERGGGAVTHENTGKRTISLELGNHEVSEEGVVWETIPKVTVDVTKNPVAPR